MQNLIIITGDLASGKSTLASALSENLGIPYVTKDALKEIVCDVIGYASREENRRLSITATDDMIYFFKACAFVGNDLILEANFRHEELSRLKIIAEEYQYHVCLIVLTGDDALLYQRFLDRLPNRHIAHRSLSLDHSFEKFVSYLEMIRHEDLVFEPQIIDMTDLDEDEVTDKALDILEAQLGI